MKPSRVKLDLLAWRPLRWLWRSPAFPVALQALAFAAWVASIAIGFGVGAGRLSGELMTLRKTNLGTLVVWGSWWPGMIAVAARNARDGGVLRLVRGCQDRLLGWIFADLAWRSIRVGLAGTAVLFTLVLTVWAPPELRGDRPWSSPSSPSPRCSPRV